MDAALEIGVVKSYKTHDAPEAQMARGIGGS